ncbi:DMT family transporter [Curtobacterium sp. L1-20]|uniref:DMT family transporter n=1 Tax=Curtobacterium sp. L1-20 TaxID=3138181 RepID=UPI003B523685
MEDNRRWLLVAATAPIAWGSTYFVTKTFLPPEPLWGGAIRALPAGLLLLLIARRLPSGSWWWKSVVLGTLNVGAFFVLVYQAAQLLPTSIAAAIMASSPVALALIAWLVVHERPSLIRFTGAIIGIGGVCLLLLDRTQPVNWLGVCVSAAAMAASSFGFILGKRWNPEVGVTASTAWQLIVGGMLLIPFAGTLEGAPPAVGPAGITAYAFLTLIATAVAYVAWFAALDRLRGDVVGVIGLLNPLTGVALGVFVAGDHLGTRQGVAIAVVLIGIVGPLLLTTHQRRGPTAQAGSQHKQGTRRRETAR